MATRYGSFCLALKLIASYLFQSPPPQHKATIRSMERTTWYWQSIHSGNSIVNWTLDDQERREIQTGSRHKTESHCQNTRTCLPETHLCLLVNVFKATELLLTYDCPIYDPPRLWSTFFFTQYNWVRVRHAKLQEYQGRKRKKYVVGRGHYLSLQIIVQYLTFSEVWQMCSTFNISVL